MHKFLTKIFATLAFLFALMATPAMAQATRTWVSGVGDDVNPCSRTAPCKTFAGAISKTAAGGEINVLDPGGFGGVTITKSITIRADGVEAGALVSGTSGITINAAATDKIVIDGLDIEGLSNGTSTHGINILSAREVFVRNTSIRGFNAAATGTGIRITGTNSVRLYVENVLIFGNNIGILVEPANFAGVAKIYNSQLIFNLTAGIRVSGTGNTATIQNTVIDRTTKSIDLISGGAASSYGDNMLSPGDAPTIIPKG